jgi:hypothetical protein
MTHFSVDIMMLELPTDIDLLLTFRNENSFSAKPYWSKLSIDSRAPVVLKILTSKLECGKL